MVPDAKTGKAILMNEVEVYGRMRSKDCHGESSGSLKGVTRITSTPGLPGEDHYPNVRPITLPWQDGKRVIIGTQTCDVLITSCLRLDAHPSEINAKTMLLVGGSTQNFECSIGDDMRIFIDECSAVLRKLRINIEIRDAGKTDVEEEQLEDNQETEWTSLKELEPDAKGVAMFGRAALDALANSFATLETLHLEGCYIDDIDLAQVLRSCSRLQWVSITNRFVRREAGFPCMNASTFIDRDSDTGTLVTWACETSLKYLVVKLLGIPRPDLVDSSTVESYPGQGREIQSQVYERLGRLINLETLHLGNEMHYNDDFTDQDDCLEMSLESGLHKLSELKKLRELSVSGMKTKIGVAEVEWMDEQWPSLGMLSGIKDGEVEARAQELYYRRLIRVLEARIQRKPS